MATESAVFRRLAIFAHCTFMPGCLAELREILQDLKVIVGRGWPGCVEADFMTKCSFNFRGFTWIVE
jgi:hypothetical protein